MSQLECLQGQIYLPRDGVLAQYMSENVNRGPLSCPVRLKLIKLERDRSVLVNKDFFFLSVPSAQPQKLVTCKI